MTTLTDLDMDMIYLFDTFYKNEAGEKIYYRISKKGRHYFQSTMKTTDEGDVKGDWRPATNETFCAEIFHLYDMEDE